MARYRYVQLPLRIRTATSRFALCRVISVGLVSALMFGIFATAEVFVRLRPRWRMAKVTPKGKEREDRKYHNH